MIGLINCYWLLSCAEQIFLFFKYWPSLASFCLFSSSSKQNNKYWTKYDCECREHRWCARYWNPGPQNGMCRRIHCAMVAPGASLFLKMGQPRPLFHLFSVFSNQHQYRFYNKSKWKYVIPSSIWRWDLNPWTFEYESSPITTKPGPQSKSYSGYLEHNNCLCPDQIHLTYNEESYRSFNFSLLFYFWTNTANFLPRVSILLIIGSYHPSSESTQSLKILLPLKERFSMALPM